MGLPRLDGRAMSSRLAALLVATLTLTGCGSTAADGDGPFAGQELVVTSYGGGWEELMRDHIVPAFEEETGATVRLDVGISTDFATKMRVAGKEKPPYDVVITNETYVAGLRSQGYFTKLTTDDVPNIADVDPRLLKADPTHTSVLSLFNPLGIAYRTDLVDTPPRSYVDLTERRFDKPVGIFNVSATPGPMLTLTLAEALTGSPKNWSAGFEATQRICPVREAGSVGDMTTLLTQGNVGIATHDVGAIVRLKGEGEPVGWQLPAEGVFAYDQNINVPAGTDQRELAMAFVDYWLSPAVQSRWTNDYFYFPANTEVAPAKELTSMVPDGTDVVDELVTFDWKWFDSGPSKQLADRWNREKDRC